MHWNGNEGTDIIGMYRAMTEISLARAADSLTTGVLLGLGALLWLVGCGLV